MVVGLRSDMLLPYLSSISNLLSLLSLLYLLSLNVRDIILIIVVIIICRSPPLCPNLLLVPPLSLKLGGRSPSCRLPEKSQTCLGYIGQLHWDLANLT